MPSLAPPGSAVSRGRCKDFLVFRAARSEILARPADPCPTPVSHQRPPQSTDDVLSLSSFGSLSLALKLAKFSEK